MKWEANVENLQNERFLTFGSAAADRRRSTGRGCQAGGSWLDRRRPWRRADQAAGSKAWAGSKRRLSGSTSVSVRGASHFPLRLRQRENVEPDGLRYWREVAATYLKLDETRLVRLVTQHKLFEVNYYAED